MEMDMEPSSVCLAAMVADFMENGNDGDKAQTVHHPRSDCGGDTKSTIRSEAIQVMMAPPGEQERKLTNDILKAVPSIEPGTGRRDLLRALVKELQSMGYNAAICYSKWVRSGDIPAGEYEYIDVIVPLAASGKSERFLVELDFRAQFEIARPSTHYLSLLNKLPSLFVGSLDNLQRTTDTMCEAARQSLKKKGLHLPPWRKSAYLNAKWLSTYKRAYNTTHQSQHKKNSHPSTCKKVLAPEDQKGDGGGPNEKFGAPERGGLGNELTVVSTDWEFPSINPQAVRRPLSMAGLAAALFIQAAVNPSSPTRPNEPLQRKERAVAR